MGGLRVLLALVALVAALVALAPRTGELVPSEPLVSLARGWEYQWGDSPRTADGRFAWAMPEAGGPDWRAIAIGEHAAPRNGQTYMWMRIRLPAGAGRAPSLYVEVVDQIFEAYLDGERLYSFGAMPAEGQPGRFSGYVWHLLPLPPDHAGHTLTFRIHSTHINIGIFGDVLIGPELAQWRALVVRSAEKLFVALIYALLGAFCVALSVIRQGMRVYFRFGVYSLGVALYLLTRTNAGHVAPLWMKREVGRAVALPSTGVPLGHAPVATLGERRVRMTGGDTLVLYTDGLLENAGPDGRRIGARELRSVVEGSASPEDVRARVSAATACVWKNRPLDDDVTLVAVRWRGAAS